MAAIKPAPSDVVERVNSAFRGYGAAIRLEYDPPIPGEPFVSMAIAKELCVEMIQAEIETLLATIEAQRNAWQPMGSAPKDGDDILVEWFEGGTMLVVSWDGESGRWDTLDGPSYHPEAFKAWQPLPTPALDAALLNRPTERN